MNPLKKYCEYLGNKDLDALCGLFADEFVFDDRGGQDLGRPPFIVEGRRPTARPWPQCSRRRGPGK